MKLGLITDVHEEADKLQAALDDFRGENVHRIVLVGDVFRMGTAIEGTCQLLEEAGVVGVWGNHDFGLCVEPAEVLRRRYSSRVFEFMATLGPTLEIEDCHFAHVEPWLDPNDVGDLWYYEGPPDEPGKLARIFDAVPHRVLFGGHYHGWLLATPERILDWNGDRPIRLDEGRWFVVVGALCEGRYAIYDTESGQLDPRHVDGPP